MFSTTSFKVSLSWEFKNSSCSRLGMFDLNSENFPFNDYFGAFCVPLSAITVFKSSSSFFFSSIRSFIIYLSLASMNASLTMPPLDDGGLYYYIFFRKDIHALTLLLEDECRLKFSWLLLSVRPSPFFSSSCDQDRGEMIVFSFLLDLTNSCLQKLARSMYFDSRFFILLYRFIMMYSTSLPVLFSSMSSLMNWC